jgi:hypothetical protein
MCFKTRRHTMRASGPTRHPLVCSQPLVRSQPARRAHAKRIFALFDLPIQHPGSRSPGTTDAASSLTGGATRAMISRGRRSAMRSFALLVTVGVLLAAGCATIRVTDPATTATQQFLLSVAAARAVGQLSFEPLRDRRVYVESRYLTGITATTQSSSDRPIITGDLRPREEQSFLLGELRARMLMSGIRLTDNRDDAQIILEVRSGGLSIDRYEYLLGLPALQLSSGATGNSSLGNIPLLTPELSIYKNTRQKGYGAVAYIAYWRDTGEVVASSGPFVGRTNREDIWLFGYGPSTTGNIPPAEK